MMLDPQQMQTVLTELWTQTNQGKLRWVNDGETLLVGLPSRLIVSLNRDPQGSITAKVERDDEGLLGCLTVSTADMPPVHQLFEAARKSASQNLYSEILEAIKLAAFDRSFAPELHLAGANQRRVLERLKGRWQVSSQELNGVVSIGADGQYWEEDNGSHPPYQLSILSISPDFTRVEISKSTSDGRPLQQEMLTLTENQMFGYVKHNGQTITYTRA
jgi:hypothetical protein